MFPWFEERFFCIEYGTYTASDYFFTGPLMLFSPVKTLCLGEKSSNFGATNFPGANWVGTTLPTFVREL